LLSGLLSSGLREVRGVNLVAYDKWNCVWIKDVNTVLITVAFNLIYWLAFWICLPTPIVLLCCVWIWKFEALDKNIGRWEMTWFKCHILHFKCFNLVGYDIYQTQKKQSRHPSPQTLRIDCSDTMNVTFHLINKLT